MGRNDLHVAFRVELVFVGDADTDDFGYLLVRVGGIIVEEDDLFYIRIVGNIDAELNGAVAPVDLTQGLVECVL